MAVLGVAMDIELRLKELGLKLPCVSEPRGGYANSVSTGNLLSVSDKGPVTGLAEVPVGNLAKNIPYWETATGLQLEKGRFMKRRAVCIA